MSGQMLHQSVLLNEVVDALRPANGKTYLDATFGNGGYSRALLDAADCSVIAIDRDPDAIARGQMMVAEYKPRFALVEGCFSEMHSLVQSAFVSTDLGSINHADAAVLDGAAFDLGVCSTQLDQADRGFSFRQDGPLDMRMSQSGLSAADVVMTHEEHDIAQILWEYGEEKASRRIAKAIIKARSETTISSTSQLAAIIHSVMPAKRPGQIDPATRSFQALRIYVNRELDELKSALTTSEAMLKPGGMLAVVSFHSLEDRIVKRFLASRSQIASQPSRHRPPSNGPAPTFELLTRKALQAGTREREDNSRARSAKLRVAMRTDAPYPRQENALCA
ncbi:16S rRNA (cytosine(1402)-N(4))-methyltransferase RsmH [Candidatus Puniceispirillum sp.]|uniref:16S rRNA (cytosine(1402)-N(4))-methyltransferase RsmH n=1 Tax=Candidatus Puniceispirillum sp. TaxID=2026719 RepID=UPI003F6957BC